MNLTSDQIEAVKQGQPVRLTLPEVGEEVVLLNAAAFHQLCHDHEASAELKLQQAWTKATQAGLRLLLKDGS